MGVTNATAAILVVSVIIFCCGLPIAYHAAKCGIDIDLLTRGGRVRLHRLDHYVADLRVLHVHFLRDRSGHSRNRARDVLRNPAPHRLPHQRRRHHSAGDVRHHADQPLPIVDAAAVDHPAHPPFCGDRLRQSVTRSLNGQSSPANTAIPPAISISCCSVTAASVVFSLVAQIGEQVDFLRFLPRDRRTSKTSWWIALLSAGPGWIILGALKLLAGSFLAYFALSHGVSNEHAAEPAHMYLEAFRYVLSEPDFALALTGTFVILSQLKINVTNAYGRFDRMVELLFPPYPQPSRSRGSGWFSTSSSHCC